MVIKLEQSQSGWLAKQCQKIPGIFPGNSQVSPKEILSKAKKSKFALALRKMLFLNTIPAGN